MDEQQGHQYFSVQCFNEAWSLLEKEGRSQEDDRLLREMAHASLFHWLQREDCEASNLSVGLWLLSRVYATLGRGAASMKYAKECIELSESEALMPFYIGFGFEAAARASWVKDDVEGMVGFLARAEDSLERVENEEEKSLLVTDLKALWGLAGRGASL